MSAYNTLNVYLECEVCRTQSMRDIQFQYGHAWLYEYALGSAIKWGPGAVGDPNIECVAVDGWLGECQDCSADGRMAILIREGIIFGVGSVEWVPELPELGRVSVNED